MKQARVRRWSHTRRAVALLCLGALVAPQVAMARPTVTPLVWAQLRVVKPGDLLRVDDAAGRHVVYFVRASQDELLALELPAEMSHSNARRACRSLARQPDLAQLDLRKRGDRHEVVEVRLLARTYRGAEIAGMAVVREGSGKNALKVVLGLAGAVFVAVFALLVAYHPS